MDYSGILVSKDMGSCDLRSCTDFIAEGVKAVPVLPTAGSRWADGASVTYTQSCTEPASCWVWSHRISSEGNSLRCCLATDTARQPSPHRLLAAATAARDKVPNDVCLKCGISTGFCRIVTSVPSLARRISIWSVLDSNDSYLKPKYNILRFLYVNTD
jgi:hypothetical protein